MCGSGSSLQKSKSIRRGETAFAYEQKKDYAAALDIYNKIKKDFPMSTEARDIEKYIGRAESALGTSK